MRIAIISTPRSGNTWVRHLLKELYGLEQFSAHNPSEFDWPNLPFDCVLQIHWHRTPELVDHLAKHGFRVLIMARHPLDVLISILQFSLRDASTCRWLEGEAGNEQLIYGATPSSPSYLDYCVGKRAAALLSISPEWWSSPGVIRVEYEQMVRAPQAELARISQELGEAPRIPIADALQATTIPSLRSKTNVSHHFWQGQSGLWKRMLAPCAAWQIAGAQPQAFATFGYRCDPDVTLTPIQADANWISLVGIELAQGIRQVEPLTYQVRTAQSELDVLRQELTSGRSELANLRQELDLSRTRLETSGLAERHLRSQFESAEAAYREAYNQLAALKETVRLSQAELSAARDLLNMLRGDQAESQQAFQTLHMLYQTAQGRLAEIDGIGPSALWLAREFSKCSRQYPLLAWPFKKTARAIRRLHLKFLGDTNSRMADYKQSA
jgi:hypothetical protein